MRTSRGSRLALVAFGVAGTLLLGSAAPVYAAGSPGTVVKFSLSGQTNSSICKNPPCPAPPPPDQRGSCVLQLNPTVPTWNGGPFVTVRAYTYCFKDTGAPLVMQLISMNVMINDGSRTETTPRRVQPGSAVEGGTELPYRCRYFQGRANASLVWPEGWTGGQYLEVQTALVRICA
jgi:hypothetical protein